MWLKRYGTFLPKKKGHKIATHLRNNEKKVQVLSEVPIISTSIFVGTWFVLR